VNNLLANQEAPFAVVRPALGNRADNLSTFGDPTRAETCWQQIGFHAHRAEVSDEEMFDSLMMDEPGRTVTLQNYTLETLGLKRFPTMRDFNMRPDEIRGQLFIGFNYNRALFSDAEAAHLERRYLALIDAALADPDASLASLRKRAAAACPTLDLSSEQTDPVAIGT